MKEDLKFQLSIKIKKRSKSLAFELRNLEICFTYLSKIRIETPPNVQAQRAFDQFEQI